MLACGVLVGILFLEETHPERKYRRDYGLELGQRVLGWLRLRTTLDFESGRYANIPEFEEVSIAVSAPCSTDKPLTNDSQQEPERCEDNMENQSKTKANGAQKAFTRQVILNIAGFGILA